MGTSPTRRERDYATAALDADPFEWALPASGGDGANVLPPQPVAPHGAEASARFRIRAVPLPDDTTTTDDDVAEAPSAPSDASQALTGTLHDSDWDTRRPGGDGSPDPFAFVHVPLITPASEEPSDLYKGMDALLGGLDVTTPDSPPRAGGEAT